MPTPTPTSTNDPLEAAVATSQNAMETMEAEAAEYFASQSSARTPLATVGDALEAAAAPKPSPQAASTPRKQASPKTASAPSAPASAAKVPGAPRLARATAKKDATAANVTPATEPSTRNTVDGSADAADAGAAEEGARTSVPPLAKARPEDEPPDAPWKDTPRAFAPGHWAKLHAKADHYEALSVQRHQEIEDLRAELEKVKSAPASTEPSPEWKARLDALAAERDAFRFQLQSVAAERIFDAESKPRREAALAQAKAAVGVTDADKVASILAMGESAARDNALEEMLSTLTPLRATKLAQAVSELDRLNAERSAAASQGNELWQRRLSESAAAEERSRAERAAKASATFDAELKDWEPVGLTADEVAAARAVYSGQGATLQDASRAALWAVAGPRAAQQLLDAQERVAELEGELEKLRGAQPGLGNATTGGLATPGDESADEPTSTSYAERIAREAMRAGLRFG